MASLDESVSSPHRGDRRTTCCSKATSHRDWHLIAHQHDGTVVASSQCQWSLPRPRPLCRHRHGDGVSPARRVAASRAIGTLRNFPSWSLRGHPKEQCLALLLLVALLASASGRAEAAYGINQAQCESCAQCHWASDIGRPRLRLVSNLLVTSQFI